MLIDRTHQWWGTGTAIASLLAVGLLFAIHGGSLAGATGGSRSGLMFGILAAVSMILAGLLAVKKSFPLWKIGRSQTWMRIHIWIGLLSVPLTLCHTGFRIGGPFEQFLMLFLAIVILSGVYGLALQQVLPRLLKVRVTQETFPQQIPHLCRMFMAEGDCLVAEQYGPLPVDPQSLQDAPTRFALVAKKVRSARESDVKNYLDTVYKLPSSAGAKEAQAEQKPKPSAADLIKAARIPAKSTADKSTADKSTADKSTATKSPTQAQEIPESTETSTESSEETSAPPAKKLSALEMARASKKLPAKPTESGEASTATLPSQAESKETTSPASPTPAAKRAEALAQMKKSAQGVAGTKTAKPDGSSPAKPKMPIKKKPVKKEKPFQAAPGSQGLKEFYLSEVRPFLDSDSKLAGLCKIERTTTSSQIFAQRRSESLEGILPVLERLEELCAERRQFLVQLRIQRWLHNWLFIHAPLSAVLFAMLAVHVVVALWVVPWWG